MAEPLGDLPDEGHLFRVLMETFSDRIYYKDRQSRFLHGSGNFLRFFGLTEVSQLRGKTDSDFFSPEHARKALADEQEIIRTGESRVDMEERETWPDGTVTWVSTSKAPLRDASGAIIGTFGISRDITPHKVARDALEASEAQLRMVSQELARVNAALEELTFIDPLTSLKNRRFLTAHLPEDIAVVDRIFRNGPKTTAAAMRRNVNLLFLMVDLDHFKRINDHHGHAAGDAVLQQMGEILRRSSRTTDTVARVGGEEFLLVARQSSRADAHIVAERVRAAVAAHNFVLDGGKTLRCTCSVGFSIYPLLVSEPSWAPWEQVVEIADQCLYVAKHAGRNAWVGLIPDKKSAKIRSADLSRDPSRLVRSGLLPLIQSADPGKPVSKTP